MTNIDLNNLSTEDQLALIEQIPSEEKQADFYQKLRKKVDGYIKEHPNAKFLNYIIVLPDLFHLSCKLVTDSRVPVKPKAWLAFGIIYCINPFDIINDAIPGLGQVDDALVMVKALSSLVDLLDVADHNIIREHWAGEGEVIDVIKSYTTKASELLHNEEVLGFLAGVINTKKNKQ